METINALPFVHKDITMVVRKPTKLVGVTVKGYQGDPELIAKTMMETPEDVAKIKEVLEAAGSKMESIGQYHEETKPIS